MSNVKTTGNVVGGAAFGNGLAYFVLWYLEFKYNIKFGDAELALAMGGAVAAGFLLYITKTFSAIGSGLVYVFNRIFPERK